MWNSSSYGGVDLSLYNAVSEEELKQQNFLKSADIKELKEACKQNSDLKIDIFKSAAICEKFTPNQLVELVTVEGFMPGSDDKSTKAAKLLLQNPHFRKCGFCKRSFAAFVDLSSEPGMNPSTVTSSTNWFGVNFSQIAALLKISIFKSEFCLQASFNSLISADFRKFCCLSSSSLTALYNERSTPP